jgi:glutamyl-tRNA synthetase
MQITEVVRGEDLITSTFRQILVLRALGHTPPAYFHCALVKDSAGKRLAKRDDALALRTLREQGRSPGELRAAWASG